MAQVFTDFSGCAAKPAPSLESFYEGQLDPDLHPDVRRRLAGWRTDAHRAARVREREHQAQLDYEGHNDEVEDWASRGCHCRRRAAAFSRLSCCRALAVVREPERVMKPVSVGGHRHARRPRRPRELSAAEREVLMK